MLNSSFYKKNTRTLLPNGKYRYDIGASAEEFVFMITKLRFMENEKDGVSLKRLKRIYENEITPNEATLDDLRNILKELETVQTTKFKLESSSNTVGTSIREMIQKYTYGYAAHLNQKNDFEDLVKQFGNLFQIGVYVGIQNIGVCLGKLMELNNRVLETLKTDHQ